MTKIAIIVGSTRPARAGTAVARWVHEIALRHGDADYELIDLKEVDLPALDEDLAPMLGRYSQPHTRRWSERISPFDGYVFVTPEYNHGMPAALKNAIDFLYAEWTNKAAAFVSYGSEGGVRAVEQLRQVMAQVRIADVGSSTTLYLAEDFVNYTEFRPRPFQEQSVRTMLAELISWSEALRTLRGRSGTGQATLTSAR
ncbi:NAD(P)H-dependent oxidoreductase [Plantactinospora mayteni]|uniref:FMN reductase n=1 Tax=Plantactinospora mayteni TaxID=566021 RepID=A0ABQ4F184_9ACTN|nr:NAD(P)H-dependent oxidoreductase [Plantactinospora mayteni]GIH00632.1 FMN reductase [Plantactinospora mayteni]